MKKITFVRTLEQSMNVYSLAFHPKKKQLIAGGSGGFVLLWNTENGEIEKKFHDHTEAVYSVAMSEHLIVTTGKDGKVQVYDEHCKKIATLPVIENGERDGSNYVVQITNDEKHLYIGSANGVLKIYETTSWALVECTNIHQGHVRDLQFVASKNWLLSASSDACAKCFTMNDMKLINTLEGHRGTIFSIAVSKNNKYIITAGQDTTLRICEIENETVVSKYKMIAHSYAIHSVVFYGENELISGGQDKILKLWDWQKGMMLDSISKERGHNHSINSIKVSNDGLLATGSDDKTIKLWRIK